MKEHPHIKKYSKYLFMVLTIMLIIPLLDTIELSKLKLNGKNIECIINLDGYRSPSMAFSTGFNYEMLSIFAKDANCSYSIKLAKKREFSLDSLKSDSLQIIVMPVKDSIISWTQFYVSRPFADSTVWVIPAGNKNLIKEINKWYSHFESSHKYTIVKERFTPSYEPFSRAAKGHKYKNASPYDHIFKKYSEYLGWDWRLLAAMVWQESRFHIEVTSPRGAAGLMQMMPSTAAKYNINNFLDPEENVEAGVKYLLRLKKIFSKYASGIELTKITLAAYNAGEGRIMDCINIARTIDLPYSTWRDIKEVIPFMRDSSYMVNDSIAKVRLFKGYETIAYVERVMSLYKAFCVIAPEPSLPDQPSRQRAKESAKEALLSKKRLNQPQQ